MGQVLVRTLACGICGSDLHFLRHGRRMVELMDPSAHGSVDFSQDVIMGHEFSAEVLEAGPDTLAPPAGTVVTSMPLMLTMEGLTSLAYNNRFPGGYAEMMLLSAPLLLEVPNGLDPRHAALTEPMAVGLHAVAKSGIDSGEPAIVIGCGPVGLAVIAWLGRLGVEPIVAADFSPTRRRLAVGLGAHETVDPRDEPAIEAWRRLDGVRTPVLFEAVGVPGMLQAAMRDAPRDARVLVVGVCMDADEIYPMVGIGKELSIQFALGYSPDEFAGSLHAIAEGEIAVAPLISRSVDLQGVPAAFDALAHPDEDAKILVEP
jgi:threonine dehydrogenase-like Zn-dependent dehydrogenase